MFGMGVTGKVAGTAGAKLAPSYGSGIARSVLARAIDGIGPLRSAAAAANDRLIVHGGDVERTISALIRRHATAAGAQGFVTNLGGLATYAATIPANVAGVMLVQCHLVASIAHLRGYDLDDPRVRDAILACLLGEDNIKALVRKNKLPSTPMVIATAPAHSPTIGDVLGREVVTELLARATGKRAVSFVARKIPVLGGGIAASNDALATWQIGQYAADQLKDRRIPSR